jgi:sugar/nucleoside kinase (ribokinase family)
VADYDVLVLGEINVDLILSAEQIAPVFGQERLVDDMALAMGSSSVIFACGAARLGLRVAFVGVVTRWRLGASTSSLWPSIPRSRQGSP